MKRNRFPAGRNEARARRVRQTRNSSGEEKIFCASCLETIGLPPKQGIVVLHQWRGTGEKTSRLERVKKFIPKISIPAYGLRGRAVQP